MHPRTPASTCRSTRPPSPPRCPAPQTLALHSTTVRRILARGGENPRGDIRVDVAFSVDLSWAGLVASGGALRILLGCGAMIFTYRGVNLGVTEWRAYAGA